jgi:hypothetical protein
MASLPSVVIGNTLRPTASAIQRRSRFQDVAINGMAIGGFPDRLSGRVDGEERTWVALPGWYASNGQAHRGAAPDAPDTTAVYGTTPSGSPQVPTGLVSIRFAEDVRAQDQRDRLATAGYEIVRVPGYAPHAAWVRATSGSIRDSLEGIERLLALPGVQAVEPELLGERVFKAR